jgi:hypothetical protein
VPPILGLNEQVKAWVYNLVFLISSLAYFVGLWGRYGQTLGKLIFGLRVTDYEYNKPSYFQATIRWLGYFLSAFPFLSGFFWIIWDQSKQGWHDKIAKTYVVHTKALPASKPSPPKITKICITFVGGFLIGFISSVIIYSLLRRLSSPLVSLPAILGGSLLCGFFVGWYLGRKGKLYGALCSLIFVVLPRIAIKFSLGLSTFQAGLFAFLGLFAAILAGGLGGFLGERCTNRQSEQRKSLSSDITTSI